MEDHEVALYKQLAQDYRGTSRQVGAWSERSQQLRFHVLLEVLDGMLGERLAGMRVLDFGCGRGDFAAFLQRRGRLEQIRYTGVDAIEENIDDARRIAPGADFRLARWTGEGRVMDEDVDLVVFSGAFGTTRMERRMTIYRALLEQARVGVVGNFLAWKAGVEDWGGSIPMEPEEALRAVDRSIFRVQLRADYLPHDFTIAAIRWPLPDPAAAGTASSDAPSSSA